MSKLAITPLRYPGGKSKALDRILPHIPAAMGEFREPFVGGGSVFLAVKKLFGNRIGKYWINDLNADLAAFWRHLKTQPEPLIDQICAFKENYPDGRELHRFLTDEQNMRSDFDRAVRFFIMNRITFSGVVDSGGYSQQAFDSRFTPSSIERLSIASYYLGDNVEVTQGDYEVVLQAPGENVFIFLDPPYWSATASKLYGVKGDLHTSFEHERFADNMRRCPHRWLITYDDSPKIRELFSFAHIIEWELQYGMNNFKQATAAKGREIFIKNY
jgi:DNA adenine methylase